MELDSEAWKHLGFPRQRPYNRHQGRRIAVGVFPSLALMLLSL